MKIRDSSMPDEAYWESLFNVPLVLSRFAIERFEDVAELGCGYGTFTIPVATAIGGTLYAFDIDAEMIARTKQRAGALPVVCRQSDVMESGFEVEVDAVLLFNILHCDDPIKLLRHAASALRAGGQVLIIHWRYGQTPRGPHLDIRPKPEQIIQWAENADLRLIGEVFDLPPWHYGLRLIAN
ncbi:MAG: class I SAM-dependent methyltransferase [Pirellulales bacterium]